MTPPTEPYARSRARSSGPIPFRNGIAWAAQEGVAHSAILLVLVGAMSTGLLIFFLFLVEVHSQSAPYVSFGGEALLNHSYVNLNFVGNADDGSDNVQCRTDLETCCAISIPGNLPGDWYFPEGNRVIFESGDGDIYQRREAQRVDLRSRNNAASPSGIYLCVIPTVAVHDNTDTDVRETVYVGIYSSGGI